MPSALARRTKLLIIAGAVVAALIINVAWVAFGPESGDGAGALEGHMVREWMQHGVPVRSVSCTQRAGEWTCRIDRRDGRTTECALGPGPPEQIINSARIAGNCRSA